ncbi:MAG: PilZ domain-containing protein [Nitrospirae bacterium]|nr:PilZ domain-containing protein [Nitrospirota bacterium]
MEAGSPATQSRRWGARATLRQPVTIRWEDHDRTGTLHNISVSGCFVEIHFPYPVGATLDLSFLLEPGTPPVVTDGQVVMRNLGGIGIRFRYRDPNTPLLLQRWVDAHAPSRRAAAPSPHAP